MGLSNTRGSLRRNFAVAAEIPAWRRVIIARGVHSLTPTRRRAGGKAVQRGLGLRQRAAEWLDLPPDALMNVARVEVVGRFQVRITNHRGVARFGPRLVVVHLPTARATVAVEGANLVIGWISRDELVVTGQIRHLRFDNGERC